MAVADVIWLGTDDRSQEARTRTGSMRMRLPASCMKSNFSNPSSPNRSGSGIGCMLASLLSALPSPRSARPSARRRASSQLPQLSASAIAANAVRAGEIVREHGVLRVDRLLSAATCAELRDYAAAKLVEALHAVKTGQITATSVFAEHLLLGEQAGKRHDVKLHLSDSIVRKAVRAPCEMIEITPRTQC